jgi:hypothetical protein
LQLNSTLIKKTAVCYWSKNDDSYIARSPLFDMTIGMGDTPEEALAKFSASVDVLDEDFKQDKLVGYGSHASPKQALNVEVRRGTVTVLNLIAERFGCTMDEAVDYLAGYMLMAGLPESPDGAIRRPLDDVIAS